MSYDGDRSKQPPECEPVFIPHPLEMSERERIILGGQGRWTQCPNLRETSSISDFSGERYECDVCGKYYRLYYDDMA